MNPDLVIAILAIGASLTSVIPAILSISKMLSKIKAEQKFIDTLSVKLDSQQKKELVEALTGVHHAAIGIKHTPQEKKLEALVFVNSQELWEQLEQLDLLREKISMILTHMEALDDQQKAMIAESVNQPSRQGQIAYLDKVINEIG